MGLQAGTTPSRRRVPGEPASLRSRSCWKVRPQLVTSLWTQIASGLCWLIYGSFFEWYWHKLWMHTPRPPKEAFRGHTIVHHGRYKGDDSYFVPEGEHPEHILLKPYALPGIIVTHLPGIFLINYLIPHTAIGAVAGIII